MHDVTDVAAAAAVAILGVAGTVASGRALVTVRQATLCARQADGNLTGGKIPAQTQTIS